MPTAPAICPGPCNRNWRQAEAASLPHDITPTWGQPVHCLTCQQRTYTALAELPELLAAIWLEATHGTARPADVTTSRPANIAPWPGQSSRLLTDLILGGLAELEDDIRDLRRLRPRTTAMREGVAVTQTVSFLTAHLGWALERHPAASEIHERGSANPAAQIRTWHRTALRFTRRDALQIQMLAPCPKCDLRSLAQEDGDDYIACRNTECGSLYTRAEYDDHVHRLTSGSTVRSAA